jgi:hypothetical protein
MRNLTGSLTGTCAFVAASSGAMFPAPERFSLSVTDVLQLKIMCSQIDGSLLFIDLSNWGDLD